MDSAQQPVIRAEQAYTSRDSGLWLGLFEDFQRPAASTHPLDDEIYISVERGSGILAGANPRSLLMAVYRYLTLLGCRWLRPGPGGERIPQAKYTECSAHLAERPSYRHRAVCIEGAVSLENVLDMVDWLPKVGMSGYFMQFREGFTFFDRWYGHVNHPLTFTVDQARQFTTTIEQEMSKRGLVYHAIGHGWTCEAYGIACLGWDMETGRAWPAEFLEHVALVGGKRSVPWDIVSIAALCYSDPQVQAQLADCVADYAAAHPQIDLLHVWLDDGFNNKCECERCQTHLPADDYINILNAIDERFTRRGLPHKIVFLAYVDMLWPPERERLANPDRFVFMFAPINRTYQEGLKAVENAPALPPFERNHLQFPKDTGSLIASLRGWQATFQGDSFVYDYHLWGGLFQLDLGQIRLARLISEDIQDLKGLGLDGMVSCQLQRVFFPTGLAQYVMARTLWDRSLAFEALAEEYFDLLFGPHGARVLAYLNDLADTLELRCVAVLNTLEPGAVTADCDSALGVIAQFLPTIEACMQAETAGPLGPWHVLHDHALISRSMAEIIQAKAAGQTDQAYQGWQNLKEWINRRESDLQPVFDGWAFIHTYDKLFSA
jgi:hypothetical protein